MNHKMMTRDKYYKMIDVAKQRCSACEGSGRIGWSEDHPYGDTCVSEYIEIDCPHCAKRIQRITFYYDAEESEIPY